MSRFVGKLLWLSVPALFWLAGGERAFAGRVFLKDGRILQGKLAPTSGLAEIPKPPSPDGSGPIQSILVIDDDLRRTFIPKFQVHSYLEDDPAEIPEKFRIRQRVARAGREISSVGPIVRVTPFDEYGRRILTMSTTRGSLDVIQAITEITPVYAKVEGVEYVWDMRIATSSIDRDVLAKILARQIDPQNIEHRKKIARFYLQSERYKEAYMELESILADFPNDPDVKEQLEPSIQQLRQIDARRILSELELRRGAGQHHLVVEMLKKFPSEGVAGEILQAVREMLEQYETWESQRAELLKRFDALVGQLRDYRLRAEIEPIRRELAAELNFNTLGRMAAFKLMVDDDSRLPEEKLALAISGWLLGGDSATEKMPVALSVFEVRELVRRYMAAGDALSRVRIFDEFQSQEAAVPELVAKLLAHMKPPLDTPPQSEATPGLFRLEVPGLGPSPPVSYLVQLPPEYDPLRRYPTIVTLHGAGTTAARQIDWWAGAWTEGGWRAGQATRRGYIVLAPAWATEHQTQYRYSAREHAAVLDSLRDACRRFAVDTDRVFLTGHSMGGDAAWDLGLAHPDLWAGVIPIVARSDRYCTFYWENAELVPFYFVSGELDGDKMVRNARDLDRYLIHRYNTTVVEYRGRGHEHFSDEIQRLFDWMSRFRRNFFPKEFAASTMRPWDNFFWWVELDQLPPETVVYPADWRPKNARPPRPTTASLTLTNGVKVRPSAAKVTIWLSPEMVDFDKPCPITVNGRRINSSDPFIQGDLETLLEDVRTRGDRQHPFWAKIEASTGVRASR